MPNEVYVVVYHDIEDGGKVDVDIFQRPADASTVIHRRFREELDDLPSGKQVFLERDIHGEHIEYFRVQRDGKDIYECFVKKEQVQTKV